MGSKLYLLYQLISDYVIEGVNDDFLSQELLNLVSILLDPTPKIHVPSIILK
jgi:hypothetical protein